MHGIFSSSGKDVYGDTSNRHISPCFFPELKLVLKCREFIEAASLSLFFGTTSMHTFHHITHKIQMKMPVELVDLFFGIFRANSSENRPLSIAASFPSEFQSVSTLQRPIAAEVDVYSPGPWYLALEFCNQLFKHIKGIALGDSST